MVYRVRPDFKRGLDAMRDEGWRHLADEALESLLVERWLYRGLMLGVILLSAIIVSYLGAR